MVAAAASCPVGYHVKSFQNWQGMRANESKSFYLVGSKQNANVSWLAAHFSDASMALSPSHQDWEIRHSSVAELPEWGSGRKSPWSEAALQNHLERSWTCWRLSDIDDLIPHPLSSGCPVKLFMVIIALLLSSARLNALWGLCHKLFAVIRVQWPQ